MINAAIVVDNDYSKNKIFDDSLNKTKFDGRSFKYISLRNELLNYGIKLNTYDLCNHLDTDLYIYLDAVNRIKGNNTKAKKFLIVIEPPSVYPNNHNESILKKFDKIFTWNDSVIDNKKYFKYNFSYNLDSLKLNYMKKSRTKHSVMISRNKISNHKDELYSKRRDIINWYEEHSPNDFDLYGKGWDELKIKSFPLTYLNRFSLLGKLMNKVSSKNLNTYKGEIRSKSQILSNYNFSFTYENIENIEGYITEKIFDSFFSLTIPIYRGANNIKDFIPSEIFIDSNQFGSIAEIDSYIKSFDNSKIIRTRHDIIDFFSSDKSKIFCANYNARIIAKHIYESIR